MDATAPARPVAAQAAPRAQAPAVSTGASAARETIEIVKEPAVPVPATEEVRPAPMPAAGGGTG